MWFDLERRDLGFVAMAPYKLANEAVLDAPPGRVFECLIGEGQPEWFKDFVSVRWNTPEPHGVGSTRVVRLKLIAVTERVLAFEPGKRFAFTLDRITLPLATNMLEDMQLEPAGAGKTRLRWDVHYAPSLAMRLVHPIGRAVFGAMFRDSIGGLRRYLAKHPESPRA